MSRPGTVATRSLEAQELAGTSHEAQLPPAGLEALSPAYRVLDEARGTERILTLRPSVDLRDALAGIAWFNGLSRAERAHWLEIAGSAVPADAWAAFKHSQEVQS